jgi:hypothetical protein
MKKFIMKSMVLALVISSLLAPVKKAEAGVTLVSGGTALVGVLAIAGGAGISGTSLLGFAFCGFGANKEECQLVTGGLTVLGLGLIVLDDEGNQNEFKTIPSYLLDEVKAQAMVKGESVKADKNGHKFVQFSDTEVDDLFMLADEFTSGEELQQLRTVLTAPANI